MSMTIYVLLAALFLGTAVTGQADASLYRCKAWGSMTGDPSARNPHHQRTWSCAADDPSAEVAGQKALKECCEGAESCEAGGCVLLNPMPPKPLASGDLISCGSQEGFQIEVTSIYGTNQFGTALISQNGSSIAELGVQVSYFNSAYPVELDYSNATAEYFQMSQNNEGPNSFSVNQYLPSYPALSTLGAAGSVSCIWPDSDSTAGGRFGGTR